MTQIPYNIRVQAGEEEIRMGGRIFRAGRVKMVERSANQLRLHVLDEEWQEVVFTPNGQGR